MTTAWQRAALFGVMLWFSRSAEATSRPRQVLPIRCGDGLIDTFQQCEASANTSLHGPGTSCAASMSAFQAVRVERCEAVKEAIRHAWQGYRSHAWGADMLKPLTQKREEWLGLGMTIVDSLDTLWLAGELEEFDRGVEWVRDHLRMDSPKDANFFETTIRVLGGLLSAYHLSSREVLLRRAVELGHRLAPAFGSSSGLPHSDVVLATGHAHNPPNAKDCSLSEVATVQLEFMYLSELSGNQSFAVSATQAMDTVHRARKDMKQPEGRRGVLPMYINPDTGSFNQAATITLGARADSYYEYLLKQWLYTGKSDEEMLDTYKEAIGDINTTLARRSYPRGLLYVGELSGVWDFKPKMDHLVCFLPGVLALGHLHGMESSHLDMAKDLMHTCREMYATTSGLAPEIMHFNDDPDAEEGPDMIIKNRDGHNILRPETVESLYYMYWITGDPKYQEWGWDIFQAFEANCRVDSGGYAGLADVSGEGGLLDKMDTFFLSETLKYLLLLFSPENPLPFDQYVLNTEAHPIPVLLTSTDIT